MLSRRLYWIKENKIRSGLAIVALMFVIWYIFSLPDPLFTDPYSTTLEDKDNRLLSAAIASDGQWRFPIENELPLKFKEAIVTFEDKRFWNHPGVDVRALTRAMKQNIAAGKVVSGGSTITMQVIRLSTKNHNRNFWVKFKEILLATRLELGLSKDEILNLYAAHAPFGGNTVGLSAACVRYFGNRSSDLSWAEAATLAVLPNDPALIHPGRNRDKLLSKRNRLLHKLFVNKTIDSLTYILATEEPLPTEPLPFPNVAPHLLWQSVKDGHRQQRIVSTVHHDIQNRANETLNLHASRLFGNHVYNGAILIAEVKSGNVVAYVGNIPSTEKNEDQVNIITSPRSTGSILKPFLFAAMLDEGKMLPTTLIPDIPLELAGFAPENFSRQFDGAVPANIALIRSLNVPAVFELREYRHEKFYTLLKRLGMTTLHSSSSHYGLTLILGGAEGSLWDVTGMYASMGRTLVNYFERPGSSKYSTSDIRPLQYVARENPERALEKNSVLSASAIWSTVESLKELYRPGEETGWKNFSSSTTIAWKTGTSLGHRDAWAVGLTPDYVVGVWVGNADGEGRPGLTGTEAAAPIMLDVFSFLSGKNWFQKPNSELTPIAVCANSGMRATDRCDKIDTLQLPSTGLHAAGCTFHKLVSLSPDKKFRVNTLCEDPFNIQPAKWFVLPPVQEYYFRLRNSSYKTLPPFRKDCTNPQGITTMDMVYPKPDSKIFIPVDLDGSPGKVVFEVAHRQPTSTVYWHIDGTYKGATQKTHQLALSLDQGKHTLTLIDESGEVLERAFTILSRH
jgi:penicillin-binding protein 1C